MERGEGGGSKTQANKPRHADLIELEAIRLDKNYFHDYLPEGLFRNLPSLRYLKLSMRYGNNGAEYSNGTFVGLDCAAFCGVFKKQPDKNLLAERTMEEDEFDEELGGSDMGVLRGMCKEQNGGR